jgi:hypothetical protein
VVDRKSITTKLIDLLEKTNYFISVMHHESRLSRYFGKLKIAGYLLYTCIRYYKWLMYLLACVVNVLLLFYYQVGYSFGAPFYREIFLIALVSLGLVGYVMLVYGFRNIPVIIQETKRKALSEHPLGLWKSSNRLSFVKMLVKGVLDDEVCYFFSYFVFTLVALLYSHLFLIYQLSFIVRIELLRGVVSAVWLRWSQLALTLLLIVLIFYYFAMVSFLWFPEQIPHQRCSKLYECVIMVFDL